MRRDELWNSVNGTYIRTIKPTGYDILINGTDKYLNFNIDSGSSGYGFRDNGGTMEWKNSGGTWAAFGSGGGSGTVTSVDMSVPTGLTISGNPITTSGTLALGLDTGYVIPLQSTLDAKQDTLVSSTNIKTINGSSILGAGDLSISGVGTGTANTIAYWDTTTSIASLATATYPSLTELSYVKGVTTAIQTQLNAKESALTFSTGLTRATNTITNNLSTGVAGGQSVIGGTAASNALTLSSTSNATKGKIIMGTGFAYHENTQRLSVGGTTDLGFTLGVAGTLAAQQSVYFAQNSGNVTFGSTLNTGQVNFSVKQSTNTGLGWIFGYDSLSTNGFYIYTNETTASPNFNIYTGATQRLTIYGTTSMVLNEAGANFDIRMEGDTNVNLFFSDASVDRIGIGHGAPDRLLHVEQADAVTNAVTYPFRVTHTSSGTVATNFGVGQEFEAENASNTNRVIGTHEFIYSDATNATEDATYKLRLIKAGTLTDALTVDSLGNTTFAGVTKTAGYTVATLPAGTVGMRAYVTDALAPAWGVAVAGGGAVVIPVFYDGVAWIVA